MAETRREDKKIRLLGGRSFVGDQEIVGEFKIKDDSRNLIFHFDPDTSKLLIKNASGDNVFDFDISGAQILINDVPVSRRYEVTVATSSSNGDFTDLESAINAVNNKGGGVIYVKGGNYSYSKDIEMCSNLEIYGDGKDTVIDFGDGYGMWADGKNNIYIHDLKITGGDVDKNLTIYSLYHGVLNFESCENVRIEFINFNDQDDGSIYFGVTNNSVIKNNVFKNTTLIKVIGGENVVVKDNLFSGCDRTGGFYSDLINISGGENFEISSNKFFDCDNFDSLIYSSCDRSIFVKNRVNQINSSVSCFELSGYEIVVANNIFRENEPSNEVTNHNPAILYGSTMGAVIKGNTIRNFDNIGMKFNNSGASICSDNFIRNCGTGIDVNDNDWLITNNMFYSCTTDINDTGSGNTKVDNKSL